MGWEILSRAAEELVGGKEIAGAEGIVLRVGGSVDEYKAFHRVKQFSQSPCTSNSKDRYSYCSILVGCHPDFKLGVEIDLSHLVSVPSTISFCSFSHAILSMLWCPRYAFLINSELSVKATGRTCSNALVRMRRGRPRSQWGSLPSHRRIVTLSPEPRCAVSTAGGARIRRY
jgi:hypothetical protein